MKKRITVDRMKAEDIRQIEELYEELIPGCCSADTIEKNFAMVGEKENYFIAVAKEGEKIVGSAMGIINIALDAPFMVVENVIVKKDCRRGGVGRMIFERLDKFAEENECEYSILVSSGFRKEAHKFYERMGYIDGVKGFRKVYK